MAKYVFWSMVDIPPATRAYMNATIARHKLQFQLSRLDLTIVTVLEGLLRRRSFFDVKPPALGLVSIVGILVVLATRRSLSSP